MGRTAIRAGVGVLLVLCASTSERALADEPPTATVAALDASQYPVITAVLTVERGGLAVQPGDIVALEVTDGGAPVDVRSVRAATDARMPLALVLALDASGSMRGPTLDRTMAAADALIARLGPEDSVAVVVFGSTVQLLQPLTTDHDVARRAVASIQATGNTRLFDGTASAIDLAASAVEQRRVVVLLSDGEEFGTGGTLARTDVVERARTAGPAVFSVGVGPEVDADFLGRVATASGGRYYGGGSADIGRIYEHIESLMRGQLVVDMASSRAATTPDGSLSFTIRTVSGIATATARYAAPLAVTAQAAPEVAAGRAEPQLEVAAPRASTLLALATVLVGGLLAWQLRARLGRRRTMRGLVQVRTPPQRIELPADRRAERRTGTLTIVQTDAQASLPMTVAAAPRIIGSSSDCDVVLDHASIAPRHARFWTRDGRLMVHRLAPEATTLVNGQSIEWGSVADGGELTLGTLPLRFALSDEESAPAAAEQRIATMTT